MFVISIVSCSKNEYTIEDVKKWHQKYSNSPLIDSLYYYEIMGREDYVMINVNYLDKKLKFIIHSESTIKDFDYFKCMLFDSTTVKDIDFPIPNANFIEAETEAKRIYSYYIKLGKIKFTTFETTDTNWDKNRIFFNFNEKLILGYFPNASSELFEYFNNSKTQTKKIKLDPNWIIFSR